MAAHTATHTGHSHIHTGQPRIKVPYSKNPVFVAEGYMPPVVVGRSFEYETPPESGNYWQTRSLPNRHDLKRELDHEAINLHLLLNVKSIEAFQSGGWTKQRARDELLSKA